MVEEEVEEEEEEEDVDDILSHVIFDVASVYLSPPNYSNFTLLALHLCTVPLYSLLYSLLLLF